MKAKDSSSRNMNHSTIYLTKRMLISKVQQAGRVAAKEAMEVMGYVVTVRDGWVVKQHADGSIERIKELEV